MDHASPHTGLMDLFINVAGEKNWPMLVLFPAFHIAIDICFLRPLALCFIFVFIISYIIFLY